jgi:hypothetical protein
MKFIIGQKITRLLRRRACVLTVSYNLEAGQVAHQDAHAQLVLCTTFEMLLQHTKKANQSQAQLSVTTTEEQSVAEITDTLMPEVEVGKSVKSIVSRRNPSIVGHLISSDQTDNANCQPIIKVNMVFV